jgi:DNA-directed RNA polymerase specialized sigma subunit
MKEEKEEDFIDSLLAEYSSVIKEIAMRIFKEIKPAVKLRELEHAGSIGVRIAISEFNLSRGIGLDEYIKCRIEEAMLIILGGQDFWALMKQITKKSCYQRMMTVQ